MPKICAVYLARAQNGFTPFDTFLQSYVRHRSGLEHDLLIVFKGFRRTGEADPYLKAAAKFAPYELFMTDFGFDLGAYGLAARKLEYSYYAFFNSFSEILAEDWLSKMFEAISKEGIGLVGATGSYESLYSNALLEREQQHVTHLPARLLYSMRLLLCRWCFHPFPNHHIRTNAFLVSRDVMRKVWPRQVLTKRGAYLYESGTRSLTKRVNNLGLKVLVVGKDGLAFEKPDWKSSNTFRQGVQGNLLVADNQSREYEAAPPEVKRALSQLAWGEYQSHVSNPKPSVR